jgi:hypothetical protein
MSTTEITAAHHSAEQRIRGLLRENNIDAPDVVEYAPSCLRLLWNDRKVAIVIDLPPEGF